MEEIVFDQAIDLFCAVYFYNQWKLFFSLLLTLFDQITRVILSLECNVSFCFFIRQMIFCWLIVATSIMHTSCVNTSNVLSKTYVEKTIFFINELLIVKRLLIFFDLIISFPFSLNKRLAVITSFFVFFARCSRFISFLTNNVRKLFFSRCFLILKIIVFSFVVFFSCL